MHGEVVQIGTITGAIRYYFPIAKPRKTRRDRLGPLPGGLQ